MSPALAPAFLPIATISSRGERPTHEPTRSLHVVSDWVQLLPSPGAQRCSGELGRVSGAGVTYPLTLRSLRRRLEAAADEPSR